MATKRQITFFQIVTFHLISIFFCLFWSCSINDDNIFFSLEIVRKIRKNQNTIWNEKKSCLCAIYSGIRSPVFHCKQFNWINRNRFFYFICCSVFFSCKTKKNQSMLWLKCNQNKRNNCRSSYSFIWCICSLALKCSFFFVLDCQWMNFNFSLFPPLKCCPIQSLVVFDSFWNFPK